MTDIVQSRLEVAALLQANGWTTAALPEGRLHPEVRLSPAFLAIPPSGATAPRLQIYFRRPARHGGLGVGSLQRIASVAAVLDDWEVMVVSDRRFTGSATRFAAAQPRPFALVDSGYALAYLNGLAPAAVGRAEQGVSCKTHIAVVGPVSAATLSRLAADREALEKVLRTCEPRFLEELVAENWRREGYDVQLVPRGNAGGPDVIATSRSTPVPMKILTSVKWKGEPYRVKKADIAELLAWVDSVHPANAGLLTTNTWLQSGAVELIQQFHRLNAMERTDLLDWTQRLWLDVPRADEIGTTNG